MRSSRATWILIAAIAVTTCIHTGCGFTRMGKNVGNMSLSRPRLMSWRKGKPENDLASAATRPPRSSIPPSGASAAGSGSRSFPSEPASNYNYASTSGGEDYSREGGSGSGNYSNTNSTDRYSKEYAARGDSSAASQRGFYDTEYQGEGGGSRFASSQSGSDYRSTDTAARGYDSQAGSPSSYGPSYGGSGTRDQDYQQVADRRGGGYDDAYGAGDSQGRSQYGDGAQYGGDSRYGSDSQYGGNSQFDDRSQRSGTDYGAQPSGGGSAYSGTRQVSPRGSSTNYDDYRSPAQDSYDDTYGTGGGYDSTHGTSSAGGGTDTTTSGSSTSWLPGSTGHTTPYGQKQLSPPTNSNWGN